MNDATGALTTTPGWRLHFFLLLLLLALLSWRVLTPALREARFGIAGNQESGGWSSDFVGILAFVDGVWTGEGGYDVERQLRVTSQWAGRPVQHAMFIGYTPTILWLFGPLCLVPPVWAFMIWALLGVLAVGWMIRPARRTPDTADRITSQVSIWLAAVFFSPTAFHCFKLGQTALLSTAGMLFLMSRSIAARSRSHPMDRRSEWMDAIVLWALAAKPPLGVTAGIALLVGRRWKTIALAFGLTVLSTALLTPWLGIGWVKQYLYLVTHHNLEATDPAFAWSLVPATMGNLRALLHVTGGISDAAATQWSSALWAAALAWIIAAGWSRRLSAEATWGLAVLAYLLFCPHVTATEELHLALVLVLLVAMNSSGPRAARWAAVACTLAVLYLAPGLAYRGSLRIPTVFASKLLLAVLVWRQYVGPLRTTPGTQGRGSLLGFVLRA
jgi:hypothetical protein